MDVLDKLQEQSDLVTEVQINKARASVNTTNPLGKCWYCGDKIGTSRRWCDAECCKDWESAQ